MPQRCTICDHPERPAIDTALATGGASFRNIAERANVSVGALHRHKGAHLPNRLAKAQADVEIREGLDVMQQLTAINAATLAILRDARASKQNTVALMAIDRVQKQIELQAKLIGLLQQEGTTNITINPQWVAIRAVVIQTLASYPEAGLAVARALAEIDHARD